ncbi:hypothetical protein [Streptomyces sp. NPDC051572]|uniref:hypothetical protein n=1 Tax=Streptomyces sp. NPDC051572 TaxID=3155802 RepID=UPI00344C935E
MLPSNRDHIFHHGPAKLRRSTQNVEIVAFTGTEESDVLHAAGDWMKEHPMAQIKAINLRRPGRVRPPDMGPGDGHRPRRRPLLTVRGLSYPADRMNHHVRCAKERNTTVAVEFESLQEAAQHLGEDARIHDKAGLEALSKAHLREQSNARDELYDFIDDLWENTQAGMRDTKEREEYAALASLHDLASMLRDNAHQVLYSHTS